MTVKSQRIVWYSCDIDHLRPGTDIDDQARQALEGMLLGLARRVRDEKTLCFPAEFTIDLETERWDTRFVAKIQYDCEIDKNGEDP